MPLPWKIKPSRNISGILLMFSHAIAMSALYIVVQLLGNYMHALQAVFMMTFIMFLIVLASCFDKEGIAQHLQTTKLELHALRGVVSALGGLSMFYAVSILNVTDAAALSKLEHSLMVILGIIIFKEKFTIPKIILLIGSLVGAFFITNFFNVQLDRGYFFIFLAFVFWTTNNVIIKKLGKTEKSRAQLFYGALFASITAFIVSVPVWKAVDIKFEVMALLMLGGICKLIHKLSFFRAYKVTDISIASPFDYMRLVITAFFAYVFLGQLPNQNSLIGYVIITVTGIYFIFTESKNLKKAKK